MRTQALALIITAGTFVVYFQNCGEPILKSQRVQEELGTFDDKVQGTLCPSQSAKGATTTFLIKALFAVNLTSIPSENFLKSDSDMDGIPDDDEQKYGFNSQNRRTNGVLDKVCLIAGSSGSCVPGIACSNSAKAIGLTSCDLAFFNSPNVSGTMTGLDSDADYIPDLVELLRGSNIVNGNATQDSDSDMSRDIVEVLRGSDVNSVAVMPEAFLTKYTLTPTQTACNTRQVLNQFVLNKMALVRNVLPYTDDKPFTKGGVTFDLSHGAGENVIAIFYVAEPSSSVSIKNELYGKILKVNSQGVIPSFTLTATDFTFLGEIDP